MTGLTEGLRPRTAPNQPLDVAIVGAGLAGLTAARELQRVGRSVQVIERSDDIGGRVRSDVVDGFILDRGFQVLLTAYPEAERQLDYERLQLASFEPGAVVWRDGRASVVVDPFRSPGRALATVFAPIGTLGDKVRVAMLRRRVRSGPAARLMYGPDVATVSALRTAGFSSTIIERFFRPLFAGIQLDPALGTSSRMFEIIFRSLSEGRSAVPAAGMGAIPRQIANDLSPGVVRVNTEVMGIDGTTVRLADGEVINARTVLIATEGPVAHRLVGTRPVASRSVGCVYFAASTAPSHHKMVMLDGSSTGPALNVALMSNVAPSYAPAGRHLIACATPGLTESDLALDVRRQLRSWWGPQVDAWDHLRTDRIEHGQPDQSPPFSPKRRVALGNGLFVCGDHRDTGSIQGALFSGRRAAEAIHAALAATTFDPA